MTHVNLISAAFPMKAIGHSTEMRSGGTTLSCPRRTVAVYRYERI